MPEAAAKKGMHCSRELISWHTGFGGFGSPHRAHVATAYIHPGTLSVRTFAGM